MGRQRGSDRDNKYRRGQDRTPSGDQSTGGSSGSGYGRRGQQRRSADRDIKNGRSLSDILGKGSSSRDSFRDASRFGGESDSGARESRGPGRVMGRKVEYKPMMSFESPTPEKTEPRKSERQISPKPKSGMREVLRSDLQSQNQTPSRQYRDNEMPVKNVHETSVHETPEMVDPGWPRSRNQEVRTAHREKGHMWVSGVIKRHPDGFGFLIPDDASVPDIYISRQFMAGVMTNDRVEAEVFRARPMDRGRTGGDRLFGEIRKVLSRANSHIIGCYLPVDRRYGVIQDDGRGWGMDLRIATEDSMGAHEGDWVAVEITEYASQNRPLAGRIVKILGDVENPLNDVIRVIHEKGIPDEFSFATKREAAALGTEVLEDDKKGREDLTEVPLITIDGATARDFDDAVFVETENGGFHVIVAIADVSHYVKTGSAIDEDAYARGTSTYFPNFVVPMLPEELSNELCSLKPDVARLCFACEMHLDFQGVLREYRFFEAVMKSQARVTYGEAQEVLDGSPSERLKNLPPVCENIKRSSELAEILMAKRFREGSLDLDVPETQVVVDNMGETIDVVRTERLFAHRLIEELMLLTNIATAKFFEDNRIHGIYRIHEEPDPENIKTVERMMWNILGPGRLKLDGGRAGLQKRLTKALHIASEMPGGQVLNVLTLRAMNQAKYSAENLGHFGLGFSHYSHFTSPIRRYPDLIAHRLIKAVLYPRYRNQGMEVDELESAATMLSACEQRSVKAERAVVSIKKARFIRRYIGEILEGTITSVAKFGIFITLREFEIDGLVKLEALGADRWVFDDQNMRLYGRRTGRVFKLGDFLRVQVVGSDINTGKIDFQLEDEGAQVEEALVVLGDEFDVEHVAEEAEKLVKKGRRQKKKKIEKVSKATKPIDTARKKKPSRRKANGKKKR